MGRFLGAGTGGNAEGAVADFLAAVRGVAVVLGPVGFNFAAGMTGGMAYVLDLNAKDNAGTVEVIVYRGLQGI